MASRGVNKVILLGNLGADPECRTFQNGDLVANFSLATSETWQDRNTGEDREKTEWHRCVAYRGLAGVVQKFVRKGSKLYIEGKPQGGGYSRGNASQHNDQGYQGAPYSDDYAQAPRQSASKARNNAVPQSPVAPQNPDAGMSGNFDDDDIPF